MSSFDEQLKEVIEQATENNVSQPEISHIGCRRDLFGSRNYPNKCECDEYTAVKSKLYHYMLVNDGIAIGLEGGQTGSPTEYTEEHVMKVVQKTNAGYFVYSRTAMLCGRKDEN